MTDRRCGRVPAAVRRGPRRRRRRWPSLPLLAAVVLAGAGLLLWSLGRGEAMAGGNRKAAVGKEMLAGFSIPRAPLSAVEPPDWVVQELLPVNEYSRPGTALTRVEGVVVHYVGNPGTTARQNRSYFANLAQTGETWASSHFVIGTDGTVIQCVPLNEIAYCSNDRNADTISIECCHPDDTGQFTPETEEALTRLLDWLIDVYSLSRNSILRHYDVNGKECPRYYVRHPEAWQALLDRLTFRSADGSVWAAQAAAAQTFILSGK